MLPPPQRPLHTHRRPTEDGAEGNGSPFISAQLTPGENPDLLLPVSPGSPTDWLLLGSFLSDLGMTPH